MNLAERAPLFGILAGIALLVVGFNTDNKPLWIVGIVLIGLGIFRQLRK